MEQALNFSVNHSLTEQDILDILTTAFEGGIGYWCCLDNTDADWVAARQQLKEETGETPCFCDVAYRVMKNGQTVKLEDEEEGTVLELTLEKFQQGCTKYTEETHRDIHRTIDNSEFDAEDADMIIQYALFGELIYG